MDAKLDMPPIEVEVEATGSVAPTLGRGGEIESRVSVGVSHVRKVERELADQLRRGQRDLLSVTMRVSFRPAQTEYFERVLFSVVLQTRGAAVQSQPIAFALDPKRLVSGPYSLRSGMSVGLHAGAPGLEVKAEAGEEVRKEVLEPYVVGAGEGESDPEWRYQRTETMVLEGAHEMGMVVEVDSGTPAEAFISLAGSVISGGRRVDVVWELDDHVARVPLQPDQ